MTDKQLLKTCIKLKDEIRQRYGKPCKELNLDCARCNVQIFQAHLEHQIEVLNWIVKQGTKND